MFSQTSHCLFNCLLADFGNTDGKVLFLDQPLPPDSLSRGCGRHSPIVPSKCRRHPSQTECKRPWYLRQGAVSSPEQQSFATHDTVDTSVSGLNLDVSSFSGEAFGPLLTSSSTPPSTPSPRTSKNAIITLEPICHREPNDRSRLRKSSSPSLTCSSQPQRRIMAYSEAWTEQFPNFNFHPQENLPLSPPPSDIVVKHEHVPTSNPMQLRLLTNTRNVVGKHENTPSEYTPSEYAPVEYPMQLHLLPNARSADEISRDPTGIPPHYDSSIFDQSPVVSMPQRSGSSLAGQQQLGYLGHPSASALAMIPSSASDIFPSPHPSDPDSICSWQSDDTLGTSGLPYTPDLHNHDAATWWSSIPRTAQAQTPYQSMIVSPVPQRPVQYFSNQSEVLEGGLMMQFGSSFDMSTMPTPTDSLLPPSKVHMAGPAGPAGPDAVDQTNPSYNHLPSVQEEIPESTHFSTPQAQNEPRSSTLSPAKGIPPKSTSTPQTVKPGHRRNRSRKLSNQPSSGPRPAKAAGGGSPTSPNGANKTLTISFVNFTPQDSHKILTGVAPSGSSKTKARRYQEARERRRKISEAALNAVRQAGGDVEALEAVLC